jgi:hypothetical protein
MKITRRQLKQIISETVFNEEEKKAEEPKDDKKSGEGTPAIVSTQYGDVDKDVLLKALNRVLDTHKPKGQYRVSIDRLINDLETEDEEGMGTVISVILRKMAKKDFIPGWSQAKYDRALGLNNQEAD